MAIEKRLKKVWTGVAWVEVFHPTSDDLVSLENGGTLRGFVADVDSHMSSAVLHKTALDNTKLANLATDADGTYATIVAVESHEGDDVRHKTDLDNIKLSNLPEDANSIFATKDELAGKTRTFFFDDINHRDTETAILDLGPDDSGVMCWVRDPSADTANIPSGNNAPAQYLWTEVAPDVFGWEFLFQAGESDLVINWEDINGAPDSTPAEIDQAVEDSHTHDNKAVLDGLDEDSATGDLTYKGNPIGLVYSTIYFQDAEPANPNVNDVWLAPIPAGP
jgi:hypothetical protein